MVDIYVCDTTRKLIVELFINLLVKTAQNNYLEQQQQKNLLCGPFIPWLF